MSHFTVLVVGNDVEDQLAPFDENMEMERYIEYTKEQLIEKGRLEIEKYKNGMYAEYLADPKEYLENCGGNPDDVHYHYISKEFPNKLNWTDEEVYEDQIKYYDDDALDEDGNAWSTCNSTPKWDWYSIGGRWTGMLKLKEGASGHIGTPGIMTSPAKAGWVDSAKKGDVDFEGMVQAEIDRINDFYDKFERKMQEPVTDAVLDRCKHQWDTNRWPNKQRKPYPQDEFKNFDEFVSHERKFENAYNCNIASIFDHKIDSREEAISKIRPLCTFAILKDGEWIERGDMGWWGIVSDEKDSADWDQIYQKIFDEIDDNDYITIVDCHI